MYDKVKYMGKTLKEWKDEIFKNIFNLGELYQMMKDNVDFNKLAMYRCE